MTARTLYDKLWDEHVVRTEADGTALLYVDRHLVHEVTSPQAFEGLRLAGSQALARQLDRRDGRPQHADHRLGERAGRHPRPDLAPADHDAGRQHPRRRRGSLLPVSRQAAGHRSRHRPRAGRHAARHDRRLWRFAHLHPRRVRRAGARHRDERGRARTRHADAAGEEGEEPAHPGRWQPAARMRCEGHRAGDHRAHRHRGRHRLHDRVRRLGHPRAQHGGSHDGVQHGHRGRRAGWPGGGRRDDDCLRSRIAR